MRGRPLKVIEYPLKECLDCHYRKPLDDFVCSRYKYETVCRIYYSSFCRHCGRLRHAETIRTPESITRFRKNYRAKQKARNGCYTCGVKLAQTPPNLCVGCYVSAWMYKNKHYMRVQYKAVQTVQASLTDLLSLPGSHKYPEYRLMLKIPPSVKLNLILTANDFFWTDKRPKHRILNYDKATWAQRFKKKELVLC